MCGADRGTRSNMTSTPVTLVDSQFKKAAIAKLLFAPYHHTEPDKNAMLKNFTPTICTLRRAIGLFGLLIMHPASAVGPSSYDDCMLRALRDSRNPAASNYIQRACSALYRNNAMLLPRDAAYHECILDNMPGVRDSSAVTQINSICSRRRRM